MQEFKGKRKVCDVRQYFVKKKEERKAQCKVCGKELAYHGGTSNLHEHLCKIHLFKYSGSGRSSEFSSKEGSIESIQEKVLLWYSIKGNYRKNYQHDSYIYPPNSHGGV